MVVKDKEENKNNELNKCVLLWEGSAAKPSFINFTKYECKNEAEARQETIKKRLEDYSPEEHNDLEIRNKIFEDVVGQDGHGRALCMGTGIRPTPKRSRVSSSSDKNLEVEIV
ncbi:hypothetical protein LguiB_031865 [Lonicera macranthoides]